MDQPAVTGLALVPRRLLRDLDGLNKIELMSHDWWGGALDDTPHAELTVRDLARLDTIAELTLQADTRFDELIQLYAGSPRGQNVSARLRSVARS